MLCQVTADEEQCMSQHTVMLQHPARVFPLFKSLPAHSIPQTRSPCLISCNGVLQKVSITIWISKQYLTGFNAVLLTIVSQQTRHQIWCQDPDLMPTSLATSRTVKWFPQKATQTLLTWLPCVDVEHCLGPGASPSDTLRSLKCLKQSELCIRLRQATLQA